MENNIIVSVCMLSYNHEKYIKKALESVLSQKTNFKYEILIHDDASPDKSVEIIQEYMHKYPDIIKPILQKENQYSKGKLISRDFLFPIAKGKYVAFCECDDYWTDEYKLQKQVDYLETHPNIYSVSHRYMIIDDNENVIKYSHKNEVLNRLFTKEDVLRLRSGTLHLNTIMFRGEILKNTNMLEGMHSCCILGGHSFIIYFLASLSGIYIMEDCMSVWREVISNNGTSFASRQNQNKIGYSIKLIDMHKRYQKFFKREYNFNPRIRNLIMYTIAIIFTNKGNDMPKSKALIELLKVISIFDILSLPYTLFLKVRDRYAK